jgi:predicted 3-demethylubiquinone-9 3-methyltransferase (glyoxalase superfamily)
MANIITFLTYKDRADEAAKFYCSIFPTRASRTPCRIPRSPSRRGPARS